MLPVAYAGYRNIAERVRPRQVAAGSENYYAVHGMLVERHQVGILGLAVEKADEQGGVVVDVRKLLDIADEHREVRVVEVADDKPYRARLFAFEH